LAQIEKLRARATAGMPGNLEGVDRQESAGSIELLGKACDDAPEQLVRVVKRRLGTKQAMLGSRGAQERLAELAAEQGLEIAEERQR